MTFTNFIICLQRLQLLMDEALRRMKTLLVQHSVLKEAGAGESGNCDGIITNLLHLYVELEKVPEAETEFTGNVLKPVCDDVLSRKGNVSGLLDEVEQFLLKSPVVKVSKDLETNTWMASYDLISNCVLPYVIGVLKKHFPHIWSTSNPDTFHSNWMRCERFITFLEDQVPSVSHLQTFRESETLTDFISKWQFPIYFQLR